MKFKIIKNAVLSIVILIAFQHFAFGQIGRVGINTNTPSAMLHVKDSSVVFTGFYPLPLFPGSPPVSGPGSRMMWYPAKAAFRAGTAFGQQWSKDSIGSNSLAMGYDMRAFGESSVAIGNGIKADGHYSVALGVNNITSGQQSSALGSFLIASGQWSTALGASNSSTGNASTAMGGLTRASGYYATSTGHHTVANTLEMFATGVLNDTVAGALPWNSSGSDHLFAVGNGSFQGRSNALTVLRNGRVGIGTINPQNKLHVTAGSSGATAVASAVGIFEDNADVSINLITPDADESGLYFGNPSNAVHGGIVYNSNVANGLAFRTNGNITRAVINDAGNFGIGMINPQKLLHVRNGPSGAASTPSAISVFEDDSDVSINIMSPDANVSAIFFGNPSSSQAGGIAYNATVPDGLDFRTNGNAIRAVINDSGNFGIGDNTPNSKLHVSAGAGGAMYHSEAEMIIEDDNQSYLQFSTPITEEAGILSGHSAMSIRSGILFRADSSVHIRTGGNTPRLTIDKSGNTNTTGEIRRSSTGSANIVPICYGSIDVNGTILSGSGNFSVATVPPGQYEITITGESYTNSGYTTTVTPVNSNPRFVSTGSSAGKMVVRTWTSAGVLIDTLFHFVVYQQ